MSYRHFYKDKWSVHIWHVYILWPFFIKKDTEEVFFHQQGTSRGNELKKISCNIRTCLSQEIKYKIKLCVCWPLDKVTI